MIQVGSRVRYVGLNRVMEMTTQEAAPHLDRIGMTEDLPSWGHAAGLVQGREYIVRSIAQVAVGNGIRCRTFQLYGEPRGYWIHEWQFEEDEVEPEWAQAGDEVVYYPKDPADLLAKYALLTIGAVYRVNGVRGGIADDVPRYGFGTGFQGHQFKAHHFHKVTDNLHLPANPTRPRQAQARADAVERAFADLARPADVGIRMRTFEDRMRQDIEAGQRAFREEMINIPVPPTDPWGMYVKPKTSKPKVLPDNDYGVTYS